MRAPAVTDAEIDRLAAPEQFGIGPLVSSGEFVDRAGVATEWKEPPFLWIVIGKWHAGIVLNDGGAVGEDELADGGEVGGVQQIGRALEQAVAGRQSCAELQKTARPDAAVRQIRTPRVAFGPGFSLAKYAAPVSSSEIGLTSRMVFPDRARKT